MFVCTYVCVSVYVNVYVDVYVDVSVDVWGMVIPTSINGRFVIRLTPNGKLTVLREWGCTPIFLMANVYGLQRIYQNNREFLGPLLVPVLEMVGCSKQQGMGPRTLDRFQELHVVKQVLLLLHSRIEVWHPDHAEISSDSEKEM